MTRVKQSHRATVLGMVGEWDFRISQSLPCSKDDACTQHKSLSEAGAGVVPVLWALQLMGVGKACETGKKRSGRLRDLLARHCEHTRSPSQCLVIWDRHSTNVRVDKQPAPPCLKDLQAEDMGWYNRLLSCAVWKRDWRNEFSCECPGFSCMNSSINFY